MTAQLGRHLLQALVVIASIGISIPAEGQSRKALFIGNSITYFNDMPQTVKALGAALGDTLDVTVYAPGGTGFVHHHADPNVFQHFSQGDWDYIVLQPGSNESPAFSAPLDSTQKWGKILVDSAWTHNPCAQILLYEISYGVAAATAQANANYYSAQSLIRTNLITLGDTLHTAIVPAGEVMRNIWMRDTNTLIWGNFGDIHPNAYGSYAIACAFAASIFKKQTQNLSVFNGLDSMRCKAYQKIADSIVSATPVLWNTGVYFPNARFAYAATGNLFNFQNLSANYDALSWSFGDGTSSQQNNPSKTYAAPGTYRVNLKAYKGGCYDEFSLTLQAGGSTTGIGGASMPQDIRVYPNPVAHAVFVEQASDKPATFLLFNVTGAKLKQQYLTQRLTAIPVDDLSPGIYLYTIERGSQRLYGKFSKY